jgi:predicted dehydrogenase
MKTLHLACLSGLALLTTSIAADLRIGLIGLDTSHVTAFTSLINDATHKNHVPGGKVVAAFKGGSRDLDSSWSRVEGYTKELQDKYGVKIVDSIEALCAEVDVVMLESVDGRPHLEQAKPVLRAKKPVFIDKPLAGSLRDAIEIFRLAKQYQVPCFSSSSLRYYPGLVELKQADVGVVKGAVSTGPCHLEPHHPDLFWYGVHPVEALYAVLGTGCESVVRTTTPDTDVITGVWKGGKVGTLIGIREAAAPYRVTLFGTKAVLDQKPGGDYAPLVREVMKFFQTGVSPVAPEETIELFAFMEAADESKRQGGKPVRLADVLRQHGGE